MAELDNTNPFRLRAMADLLGIPIERFFDAEPAGGMADESECLRLWSALQSPAGRAAALAALRKILDEEGN